MNAPRLKFQTSTPSFIKNYSNSNHLIPALGLRLPTGFLHLNWLWYNMGLRMFLLIVLGLLVFTDHSQGDPETREQSLTVNTLTDASAVGKPMTTANPIHSPRHHVRQCNCKGKGGETVNARCPCHQSGRRNGKQGKLKAFCQRKKNKNLKKCSWKQKRGVHTRKYGPSVPI
ncbi:uncharacterized protein LOC144464497 [Epinephelus lanceolatus]